MPGQPNVEPPATPFEWAARGPLTVRRENFDAGLGIRLLFVADLHLAGKWTERVANQVLSVTRKERPDLVLLGGDLVDRKSALPQLGNFLEALQDETGEILAIPGNHDRGVGEQRVRETVIASGARWLPEGTYRQGNLAIHDVATSTTIDAAGFNLLCLHNPADVRTVNPENYNLILAGHLHGCQWVLWKHSGKLYPGAWFYRWNGPRFELGPSTLLVSQGVNDTLPLRWNCPREILACSL